MKGRVYVYKYIQIVWPYLIILSLEAHPSHVRFLFRSPRFPQTFLFCQYSRFLFLAFIFFEGDSLSYEIDDGKFYICSIDTHKHILNVINTHSKYNTFWRL